MTKQSLKAGTRIEMHGTAAFPGFPGVAPEMATIGRWTAKQGPIKNHVSPTNGGWHVVNFASGGALLVHESRFRVIDNRGVSLDPKTNAEALATLRWMYGPQVPASGR